MPDPYTIKVDTAQIRELAKSYDNRASGASESGKTVRYCIQLTLTNLTNKNYDDPVFLQKMAMVDIEDLYNRNDKLKKYFDNDSSILIKIAEAFEVVDGETVKIFEECQGLTTEAGRADLTDVTGKNPPKYYWRKVGEPYLVYGPWICDPSKGMGTDFSLEFNINELFSVGPIQFHANTGIPKMEVSLGKIEARQVTKMQKMEYVEEISGYIRVLETVERMEEVPWYEYRYVAP